MNGEFEFEYLISFCRVSEYLVGLKRKNRSLAARLSKNALSSILSLSSALPLKENICQFFVKIEPGWVNQNYS